MYIHKVLWERSSLLVGGWCGGVVAGPAQISVRVAEPFQYLSPATGSSCPETEFGFLLNSGCTVHCTVCNVKLHLSLAWNASFNGFKKAKFYRTVHCTIEGFFNVSGLQPKKARLQLSAALLCSIRIAEILDWARSARSLYRFGISSRTHIKCLKQT